MSTARTREHRGEARGDRTAKPPDLNGARVRHELDRGEDLTIASPPPRLLFVVADHQVSFYRHLARGFDRSDEVQVILDRRTADRRCSSSSPALERRREERRSAASAALLRSPGWLMTWSRTAPRVSDAAAVAGPSALPVELVPAAPAELAGGAAASVSPVEAAAASASPVGLAPVEPTRQDHGDEVALSPLEPVRAETSDDWGGLTDEDQLRIKSIRAKLDQDYADDVLPARDTERDPVGARDKRPAIVVMLAGGLLAVAALGYAAVAVVASRARAVLSDPPASENVSTRAGRETAAAGVVGEPSRVELLAPGHRPRPEGSPAPAAAEDERAVRAAAEAEVSAAFKAWLDTINQRQVVTHVAWYADPVPVFYNGRNVPRSVVHTQRSRTFNEAARIDVQTSEPDIHIGPDGRVATMVFRKRYVFEGPRANRRGTVVQELTWRKAEDGWRITGERALEEGKGGRLRASKQS